MSAGGPLITWRTSIGMLSGAPPGPGAAEASRGDLVGALGALDVDDPVAGQELLRLREQAVGDRACRPCRRARASPAPGPARPSAPTSSPDSPSFFAKPIMKAMCALMSSCGQLAIWYGPPARGVHHQHVLHGRLLAGSGAPAWSARSPGSRSRTGGSRHRRRTAFFDISRCVASVGKDWTNSPEDYGRMQVVDCVCTWATRA